ncbi:MAG: hypothetical protein JXQ88_03150 [Shimia sp.]
MKPDTELTRFVRDSLDKGLPEQDIRDILDESGWSSDEIDLGLSGWRLHDRAGVVPQPQRDTRSWDALHYLLLFFALGMVLGNILSLLWALCEIWIPQKDFSPSRHGLKTMRWSLAALFVVIPAFLWLDFRDSSACKENPARRFGGVRRWLTAIVIFGAAATLICDAIFVLYGFLDGGVKAQFLAKSAVVAALSLIVIVYFRQDRLTANGERTYFAVPIIAAAGILTLATSFATIGGPFQAQNEANDRIRAKDLRILVRDVDQCDFANGTVPESLDPMTCARNPERLTSYANQITYQKLSDKQFELCIALTAPDRFARPQGRVKNGAYCMKEKI